MSRHLAGRSLALRRALAAVAALALLRAPAVEADRTPLKPGWNL